MTDVFTSEPRQTVVPSGPARVHRPAVRLDALVLDADQRQSLVCVRSLGRAGVRAGAYGLAGWSPARSSRWCHAEGPLPDASRPEELVDSILELVEEHEPRVVIPSSDGMIEALRARRIEVERLASLALAPESALRLAVDKAETLALATTLGISVPKSLRVDDPTDIGHAVDELGLPAVAKPVASWVQGPSGAQRLTPCLVVDRAEARAVAERAIATGGSLLVQEWLTGSREAVSLLYADGQVRGRFAQLAHRMFPPFGGSSVVRESITLPPDLLEAAEALVAAAGLEGYSEIEFRRDAAGRARLMEINPRLSASVEVAVRAGVDFPRLLYSWASGSPLPPPGWYRVGVRMRWLGGDVRWLRETLRSQGRPDVVARKEAVAAFAGDFFRPTAYDYVAFDDLRPALVAMAGFAARTVDRVVRKRPAPGRLMST